ncbi:hypothetical protein AB0D08_11990 [Kitasatospora sp. NPDC048540]|uniref:hypothetical protein n=1 Tax=Kitasatospora sp. NPDC048540 TaxID=3155634 RepID=UPI0034063B1B
MGRRVTMLVSAGILATVGLIAMPATSFAAVSSSTTYTCNSNFGKVKLATTATPQQAVQVLAHTVPFLKIDASSCVKAT